MEGTKRIRRSKEERIDIIEKKILTHKANIEVLEAQKQSILNPSPRRKSTTIKNIITTEKQNGMTEQEIAEKLGIKLD